MIYTLIQFHAFVKTSTELIPVHNKPLYILPGVAEKITNQNLLVVAENTKSHEVIYSLKPQFDPTIGIFLKNGEQTLTLSENYEEEVTFTQGDINKGLISYLHPYQGIEDILKMHVYQNEPVTVTKDFFPIKVDTVPSTNIIFIITKKLLKEEGILENNRYPGVIVQSFTQRDLENLKLVYHPPSHLKSDLEQFIFQFVVVDIETGSHLSQVLNFTITVVPHHYTTPSGIIDYEIKFDVTQGQSVHLGYRWLFTDGHTIPEDQLEVVLINKPLHGSLFLITASTKIEILEDDGFAFMSIMNDVYYEHDGSNTIFDSAVFQIMGGHHSTVNRLQFKIIPNDTESPVLLDSSTLMGTVVEAREIPWKIR